MIGCMLGVGNRMETRGASPPRGGTSSGHDSGGPPPQSNGSKRPPPLELGFAVLYSAQLSFYNS